jgi:hypothetical protein
MQDKGLKTKLRTLKVTSDSKLTKSVITDLLSYSTDNYDICCHIKDTLNHGCQSGTVGSLIYYSDTTKFYNKHKADIMVMLQDCMQNLGVNSPYEVFGDKFDKEDYFIKDTQNQNLLAWFGYEETLYHICNKLGIEY